jgi:hypothetical protein
MDGGMQSSTRCYLARTGLIAKGIVYVLIGVLAFMAAFELGGENESPGRTGVFGRIQDWPAGNALLLLLAAGLLCYTGWRLVEAVQPEGEKKDWKKRLRYVFSGLAYLSAAITAFRVATGNRSGGGGNQNQQWAAELLSKPAGAWLLGVAALVIGGVGIYQIYYGLSEKYRKHAEGLPNRNEGKWLLRTGKVGYVARGVVWLLLSFLLGKAAWESNARAAGDTKKAFQLLESATLGSYLLGAMGLGLAAYGVFNFVRARYVRS